MSRQFPSPFYRWRPHPWHGLEAGPNPPQLVYAYIEITPYDLVKYEIDKITGYLRVDRPQRTSSQPPALYGFIPRTYCDQKVAKLSATGQPRRRRPARHLRAQRTTDCAFRGDRDAPVVVGGLDVNDHGEADDKIIAVLENDHVWGQAQDITDLPDVLVERLRHYFATYKLIPGQEAKLSVERIYDRGHALRVVEAALADYGDVYGE